MDKNVDNSTKMQVVIGLRYTNNSGAPLEHLLAVLEASSSTGEALSNKLLETWEQLGLSTDQLVGQALDGVQIWKVILWGLHSRIRVMCPQALYTWCKSHMSNTADDSSAAGDCFNNIKKVYLSESSSAHRARVIEKHLLSLLTTEG